MTVSRDGSDTGGGGHCRGTDRGITRTWTLGEQVSELLALGLVRVNATGSE